MSSLGDVLHTLPFAAELRKLYPNAKISWLVHPQFAGFVPDPPVIDEVLYFDKVKFNKMSLGDKIKYFKEMRTDGTGKDKGARGCITDIDGKFSIRVGKKESVSISYIGYEAVSKQITKEEHSLIIELKPSIELDDVVVTGISRRNKNSFTGNYVEVKGDALRKMSP